MNVVAPYGPCRLRKGINGERHTWTLLSPGGRGTLVRAIWKLKNPNDGALRSGQTNLRY